MDKLDEHLHQLALEAQEHFGTLKGRQLLTVFWETVYRSGRLTRPHRDKIPGNYEDVYDEAVERLMKYTLQNICKYDPSKSRVIGWLNMLLDRRFIREAIAEVLKDRDRLPRVHLAETEDGERTQGISMEAIPSPESPLSLTDLIKQYLEDDPDQHFKNTCIPKYPHITFQDIALKIHLKGYSFREISQEYDVPYTSIVAFYQRRLQDFAPIIRQYVEDHL